ncbi:hypothetical protein MPLDJ20_20187 [Mesorhizobium plurifarium]|uniref:Uncharacterized protein n=1 Tax=Mesorhizobium plurifarium TaxID=69974 RepID=A0A090EUZ1_MESPL|nr:hypothetical protein MPLSOD_150069 [Mesorhizobium sp. SOD10]CDX35421.1 hypothetical protein MPLDJ20_20187 [Mesorhizobium plurifarium]
MRFTLVSIAAGEQDEVHTLEHSNVSSNGGPIEFAQPTQLGQSDRFNPCDLAKQAKLRNANADRGKSLVVVRTDFARGIPQHRTVALLFHENGYIPVICHAQG